MRRAHLTESSHDMTRVNANGYFDAEDSEEARHAKKTAMCAQRLVDYKAGEYALGGGVVGSSAGRCSFLCKGLL